MAYVILTDADQVTDEMLEQAAECVDWFLDGPMPTDEFIDRLCKDYGASRGLDGEWDGWDITDLDTPAVRKIMRHARAVKREAT